MCLGDGNLTSLTLVSKCSEEIIFGVKSTCTWRCQDICRLKSSSDHLSENVERLVLCSIVRINCVAVLNWSCLLLQSLMSKLTFEHQRHSERNCAFENLVWLNKYLSIKGESEETDRGGSIIIAFIKYGDK